MGRHNKKRIAKRKKDSIIRNSIRKKMGKRIYFTLTHCSKKLKGISNKYNYKANMHNLCFVGAYFYNVKYQASIITGCNFRNANLVGVDFYNCNMKNVSFKNASFESVVFYNCNLKDAEFIGASFSNVTFICTNLDTANNLDLKLSGITILNKYPTLNLNEQVKTSLLSLSQNESILNAKVLHVNKNKLNNWALEVIKSRCGEQGLVFLSKVMCKKEKWNNLYTVFSYISLIEHFNKL